MNKPRVKLPEKIKIGDVIEIKTLVSHVMETGQRRETDGKIVPRNIIHSFRATFNGRTVFEADLQPGVSANPFLAFYMKVTEPGDLELSWTDDGGDRLVERTKLNIV